MSNTVTNLLLFSSGAIIGSVITWQMVKTKYERIAQEEIDSVLERFSSKKSEKIDGEGPNVTESDIRANVDIIKSQGYVDYSGSGKEIKKEVPDVEKPYVIAPTEFDELDDYESESLVYYADGVLTDDQSNLIDDVDAIIGRDSLTHFGEYEDDSVFVRNDRIKTDYEILLDPRKYTDVFVDPILADDE